MTKCSDELLEALKFTPSDEVRLPPYMRELWGLPPLPGPVHALDVDALDDPPVFITSTVLVRQRRRQMSPSGQWDEAYLRKLKIETAGEYGLTQRAILNVLLADWLDLPVAKRRPVKDRAIVWNREMQQ